MNNPLSNIQKISHPLFSHHNVEVFVKRDDLIHQVISGNKWRKLKFNLKSLNADSDTALTFGGSYSNHIHAFSYACFVNNIPCIGVIRGEAEFANNFTLSWAKHWGMHLHFVDRKTYRRRSDTDYQNELRSLFPNVTIIPEGGSNKLAIAGVSEVIHELKQQINFDTILTPVGSGGTLAGLISGDSVANCKQHQILGVAVLKQAEYLIEEVKDLLSPQGRQHKNWQLLTEFHRGGYAKMSTQSLDRLIDFNNATGITFEPVYSGKMVLALLDLLQQGYFKPRERIVLLHTGGLQGLGGMLEQGRINAADWPCPPIAPK